MAGRRPPSQLRLHWLQRPVAGVLSRRRRRGGGPACHAPATNINDIAHKTAQKNPSNKAKQAADTAPKVSSPSRPFKRLGTFTAHDLHASAALEPSRLKRWQTIEFHLLRRCLGSGARKTRCGGSSWPRRRRSTSWPRQRCAACSLGRHRRCRPSLSLYQVWCVDVVGWRRGPLGVSLLALPVW